MASHPERLRKQAQSISSGSKGPKEAWKGLREWASERGPMAMDIAVHEFLATFGRDPSAASLMPDVMHGMATLPLKERVELSRKREPELSPSLSMSPKSNLALTRERPDAIRPINVMATPIDPVSMRDMPMRMHEQTKLSLQLKQESQKKGPGKSGARAMSAGKAGHHILHSLIRHISSHGRSDAPKRRKRKTKAVAKKEAPRIKAKTGPKAKKRAKKATPKRKPKLVSKKRTKVKRSRPRPKPAKKKPKAKKVRPKTRKSTKKKARPKPKARKRTRPKPAKKRVAPKRKARKTARKTIRKGRKARKR